MSDDLIRWGYCDCNVWPVYMTARVGRCGRCRAGVNGRYAEKDEALDAMHRDLGRGPAPWPTAS